MKITKFALVLLLSGTTGLYAGCSKENPPKVTGGANNQNQKMDDKNFYDLTVLTMDGQEKKLSDYEGKVLLIVNVASKCGYTKQYSSLEAVYRKYSDQGFVVLGFPSNDFGGQEPGTNDEIRTFCETKFDVTFPLFDKVEVLGNGKSPLYSWLTSKANPSGDIDWNFEKFVISKKGEIAGRYKSKVEPDSQEITSVIESELAKN